MRAVRTTALVLIVGSISMAACQLAVRTQSRDSQPVQAMPKVEIISTIPRNQSGLYDLGDVALLDDGEAWAVGYDGEHTDRVYHSTDAGKTWQAVAVPGNGFTFRAVAFADSQHGWAVGGNGLLVRTANGGKSWELLKAPTGAELHQVHFANSRVGYVAGREGIRNSITDEVTGSVEILCTRDGGETWRRCYKEHEPGSVFQIKALSASQAFAVLDGNHLIRTDDGGKTWRHVPVSAKYVFSIAFASNGVGWLVGNGGCFQRSDDGGKSWRESASLRQEFASKDWEAVSFNSNGVGLAVGENGALAVTTDNGNTWQLRTAITSDHLRGLRMQGSHAVILGAEKVYSIIVSTIAQSGAR